MRQDVELNSRSKVTPTGIGVRADISNAWVADTLARHRRVEGLVHRQVRDGARHALVEDLVHRQHIAELQAKLLPLPVANIIGLLETLLPEDSQTVWDLLSPARGAEILDQLPEALQLSINRENDVDWSALPVASQSIQIFERVDERLRQRSATTRQTIDLHDPVWIDLLSPTPQEYAWIEAGIGYRLPDLERLMERETGAAVEMREDGSTELHVGFLLHSDGQAETVPVVLILRPELLITIRRTELPVFRVQRLRARLQAGSPPEPLDLLIDLFGTSIEFAAAALEGAYRTLDSMSTTVMSPALTDTDSADVLARIARQEDINGRVRRNVEEIRRALSVLMRGRMLGRDQQADARQVLRDIESLEGHTRFLFSKINFLLDATVGFVNISQNRRISRLTILGVILAPINILVGIGGMSEFSMMTSAWRWQFAYGALLAVLLALGVATWSVFKRIEKPEQPRR